LHNTQLVAECLVLLGAEFPKSNTHFLELLLVFNEVIFLVLAHLQGVHVLDECGQSVRRFGKSVLDLLKSVLDVASLLVGLLVEVAPDVGLLLLNLADQGLSKTLTYDVDEALQVLGPDVSSDDAVPALKTVEPSLGDVKVSELGLEILVEVHLGEIVHLSAILDLVDIWHEGLEVRVYLLRDSLFGSAASEGVQDDVLELATAIGDQALDELVKVRVANDANDLICNILHFIE